MTWPRKNDYPSSEYLGRVTAVRMQFDTMGAETMLLLTDLINAQLITLIIDSCGHEYIIGATLPVEPLTKVLAAAMESGKATLIGLG